MRISIHHLTLTETTHDELIDIAASLGCAHICTFIKVPGAPGLPFPRVESLQAARNLRAKLESSAMSVWNVDTFMIQEGVNVADYRETLEIAATLGAKTINALNLHPEPHRGAEILSSFSKLAAEAGLSVLLEWFRFSATTTLAAAREIIRLADRSNIQLNVDILHLMRNGGQPADLAAVDPALMQYAQICDAPLHQPVDKQMEEAVAERNFPGAGEFPLVSFVRHLPEDAVLSIEAPVNRLRGTLGPADRARRAVAGTRQILAAAGR
jgi:sugar phosphate isomerase/epimerase